MSHTTAFQSAFRKIASRVLTSAFVLLSIAAILLSSSPAASALTPAERRSYALRGIYFIDDPCAPAATTVAGGTSIGNGEGVWNSGLQPPYILEQFMIELLKDIAAKRGVPATNTVTEQHVIALIAFAYGEGGGITNNDFWNPFNTGINAPDLLATGHSTSGVQAFKSFDAGVEANARVMSGTPTSKYQTRLGDVLTKPDSTVQDFFHTLTYYQETEGNLEWAEASMKDPAGYYNNYVNKVVTMVLGNWDKTAALIMRGSTTDPKNQSDPSKLTYHPSGAGNGTNGGTISPVSSNNTDACAGASAISANAAGIAEAAKKLAWPQGGHGPAMGDATKDYQDIEPSDKGAGFKSDAGDNYPFSDCGVFVATVMRYSAADINYPKRGSDAQYAYLQSHADKYERIHGKDGGDPKNASDTPDGGLHPGDIFVTTSGTGHTYVFVGQWGDGNKYNAASASWHGHVPQATNFSQDVPSSGGIQHFAVFRLK